MRNPGEILLISCYELGHQPLAIGNAAAFLEREGFAPALRDLSIDAIDEGEVARARLVAISVPMHTALRLGVKAAVRVREINPSAHICFFGLYASLNADWLLDGHADSAIGGETEAALVALATALESGAPLEIAGVAVAGRAASPIIARLGVPAPAREKLPGLDRYAKALIDGEERLAGAVEATRGCLHLCRHCPIPAVYEGRFFAIPVEVVMTDVRRLVAAGARHVTFADPDFWNGPAHADRVLEAMHAEFPALSFDATIKIEHLLKYRERIPRLRELGCAFVVAAVESLSDVVLGILDKGHSGADVRDALRLVRASGLTLRASLLPFTPWSTLEDYVDLLDFIEEEDLVDAVDAVQLSIRLLVPPGSLLEKHPSMEPHLRVLDRDRFTWRWTHPDPRMDALATRASQITAAAAQSGEEAGVTFARLREAALAAGAKRIVHEARAVDVRARRPRAPRLTEPWFC